MIDSVLKGAGNSRFLKSAVPAGTSWADALAMLQAGTFPIDFNGINTEGFQQVGTPLNKANLLKDATAAQIGLPPSTTPDGMFQALGNTGELHVWRKTVVTTEEKPAGYTLGDAESGTAISVPNVGSQNYVTLQYGPSITVNDGGGVSLTSVTGSVRFQQNSNVSDIYDIRNNFVIATPNGGSNSAFDGVIFVPNDCSFKKTAGIVTFGKFYRVNAYPKTPAGTTTTYPVSTNPNAYQEGDDAKAAGYVVGEVVTGQFKMSERYPTDGYYYKYASSISVADNGTISLDNPSQISFDRYNGGQSYANNCLAEIAGKFVYLANRDSGTSAPDSKPPFNSVPSLVVYIPSDATLTWTEGGALDGFTLSKYQPVTGYAAIPAGTTIEYLGKLGDKARVQVVNYVGTGTYGSSNPNSLTFDSVPKVVFITSSDFQSTYVYSATIIPDAGFYSITMATYMGYESRTPGGNGFVTKSNKTIMFYSGDATVQLNISGLKYIAVAIG